MRNSPASTLIALLLISGPALAGWDEGLAAFKKGDFAAAADEFRQVVEQNPDAYQGNYMLGLSLTRLDRHEEALHHLRKAYDLNPNDLSIKLSLGSSYHQVGRHADAAELLGTVSASEAGKLGERAKRNFYMRRATECEETGNASQALADYKVLAGLYPEEAALQFKYGVLASNSGHLNEAVRALERALQASPGDQGIMRSYAIVLKKRARLEPDASAKQQTYLKAVDVAKDLVTAEASYDNLLLRCQVELGGKLYAEALESCRGASSRKTGDWLARYYLGQAYSGSGRYAQAEMPLTEAKRLASEPNDKKAVARQLGFVYEQQTKYSESKEAYAEAGDELAVARVALAEAKAIEKAAKAIEKDLLELESRAADP